MSNAVDVSKSIIESLNFYELLSILWGLSLVINIFRGKLTGVAVDAAMVVANVALGEWVW